MKFRSVADLSEDLRTWRLPDNLDLIVGVPRSGMLVASLLALYKNVPITDVQGFCEKRLMQVGSTRPCKMPEDFWSASRRILVVDDSLASGISLTQSREKIESAMHSARHQISYAAVYVSPESRHIPDHYRDVVAIPRLFEWNLLHGDLSTSGCWDIDGVFCRDPTAMENDDGENYRVFLSEVEPFMVPSRKLHMIVTSRLEKYRDLTEQWLEKHGIRFGCLAMLDLPDKESRLRRACHAEFKAEVYKKSRAKCFVESCETQAVEIARRSGKYVICTETMASYCPEWSGKIQAELGYSATRLRTRTRRLLRFAANYITGRRQCVRATKRIVG